MTGRLPRGAAKHAQLMAGGERGSVSIMVAVLALGLLAMTGLVVDGGGKAKALTRADDMAAAAARCGMQALDIRAARGGQLKVNPTAAASRARRCLAAAGMTGTVQVTDSGRRLHVTADEVYRPVFLSMLGVNASTVTGQATVELVEVQQGEIR